MKKIEDLIGKNKKYEKTIVQKKLKSKKNTVAYVMMKDKPRVLKWFVPGLKRNMENEYKILKKAKPDLNVPVVYEKDDENNVLIMNYISGENLCDIINDEDTTYDEKERLMILLSEWFYNFHNFFKKEEEFIIHGDPTLRNFVFTDQICGMDFEEIRTGKPSEDIAGMCASILSTDPMFTEEKFKLSKVLINKYTKLAPGRIANITDEIAYSLLEKIQWRPEQEEMLRKYSKEIRKKGI
jgi:tRNA A-37 threonylcarbamoyl transferase component Bud32